eukprot:4191229-Alexandrium_andersonii.AAC.1
MIIVPVPCAAPHRIDDLFRPVSCAVPLALLGTSSGVARRVPAGAARGLATDARGPLRRQGRPASCGLPLCTARAGLGVGRGRCVRLSCRAVR